MSMEENYVMFLAQLGSISEGRPVTVTLNSLIPQGHVHGFLVHERESGEFIYREFMVFDETHLIKGVFVAYTEPRRFQETKAQFIVHLIKDMTLKSMTLANFGNAGIAGNRTYRDVEYSFSTESEVVSLNTSDASKYAGGKQSLIDFATALIEVTRPKHQQ